MTMIASNPPAHFRLALLARLRAVFASSQKPPADCADDARARIDFIQEMLEANPAAFHSEQDIQNMMHCFPGRF